MSLKKKHLKDNMEKFIDSVRPKGQNKREEKAFMKA